MRRIGLTVGVLCAALTAGCSNPVKAGDGPTAGKPAAVALVLVDVSKSTFSQRGRYSTFFDDVVDGLPGGSLLIADQLGADPLSSTSLPVRAFFEKSTLLGKNQTVVDGDNRRARAKASKVFRSLLGRRPKGNSILDALTIAQDVFSAYPDAKRKYLILFSDMVENSPRYRFTPPNLVPKKVRAYVAEERKTGQLPDLHGVQVYVAGAGATLGSEAQDKRILAVRQFWFTYFAESGAALPRSRYGSQLVRFP